MEQPNFWDYHGILFLIFITLFPRLTLLFSSVAFGGFLWWIGFIFAPRFLVAILATITYGTTNPILVGLSWLVALSGESGEKYFVKNRVRIIRPQRGSERTRPNARNAETIEAKYERLDE